MSDEAATNQQSRTVMSFPEAVAFNQGWKRGEAYGRKKALREAEAAALGPSVSGILHDGATTRDIALAIQALADGDAS